MHDLLLVIPFLGEDVRPFEFADGAAGIDETSAAEGQYSTCGRCADRRVDMFVRILLLLTIAPLVELMILLRLADLINWKRTFALVVLTGVLGAWLARREGLAALTRIQSDLDKGVAPTGPVVDAVLILVAGVVLVTPGVLTDLIGFALLIAPIRRYVRRRATKAFKAQVTVLRPGQQVDFIDIEAVDSDDNEHTQRSDRSLES